MPSTLYLIDASPYIFRAFYSLPSSIRSPEGRPVNAVRGFADFLGRLLREERPGHALVAFDGSLTTSFRNEIYPPYKSSRDEPDADLVAQIDACREVTRALGFHEVIDDRYEADDLVATAKERFAGSFGDSVVVSADKDLMQLVDPSTSFYDFGKGTRIGAAGVRDKMGVEPEQIRDLLGLAGDSVDDIPGVRGVGPKTAVALLGAFRDLDDLYGRLEDVAGVEVRGAKTLGVKLEASRELAFLSRELATCALDAPLDVTVEQLAVTTPDREALADLAARTGIESLARFSA